jgi:hypothetical protein
MPWQLRLKQMWNHSHTALNDVDMATSPKNRKTNHEPEANNTESNSENESDDFCERVVQKN